MMDLVGSAARLVTQPDLERIKEGVQVNQKLHALVQKISDRVLGQTGERAELSPLEEVLGPDLHHLFSQIKEELKIDPLDSRVEPTSFEEVSAGGASAGSGVVLDLSVTRLYALATADDIRGLSRFKAAGGNIHQIDSSGLNILQLAAKHRKKTVLTWAIQVGVGREGVDKLVRVGRLTALMYACTKWEGITRDQDRPSVVKLLIENCADVEKISFEGKTALQYAEEAGFEKIVRYLKEVQSKKLCKKFEYASVTWSGPVITLQEKMEGGRTETVPIGDYLGGAARRGDLDNLKKYIQYCEFVDSDGRSILCNLTKYGHVDALKKMYPLVSSRISVNQGDDFGCTPIIFVSARPAEYDKKEEESQEEYENRMREFEKNKLECAQFLIERGADLTIKDSSGVSPLTLAVQNRFFTIVQYFLSLSNPELEIDPLTREAAKGSPEMSELIVAEMVKRATQRVMTKLEIEKRTLIQRISALVTRYGL